MRFILLPLFLPLSIILHAQDIAGRWTTIDDKTGRPRSVVEIRVDNGVATGHIVEVKDPEERDALCEACTGELKNAPVMGMRIINDMVRHGDEWRDGTILDPETGKVYTSKMWIEDGNLKVRGYVAFFFRTQTWVRENR